MNRRFHFGSTHVSMNCGMVAQMSCLTVFAMAVCMQRALDHLVALLATGSLALLRYSPLLNRWGLQDKAEELYSS
jgi:hypothetical protein